ncbi:hypothetical protein [Lentilactobacillus farraginis]|uniref:Uncharacterized protein n=1 Tax=Lentilactobacillus farraginis DSM 18382 = JCM 14108 TaxID=1423743 RepID=X0PLC2_9LACO|nr:hypothetical protein [Lentilactobacillus farraginis]KRM01315.1 hypothetical protein FD41_GL001619 [Lentilactobacillus farraginis DSM 18382 = JCM 14108]GAF38202.1 hypothetical protein JCM14108_3324 [Lentilactobacillus farraginis DSM 18382 = JCM 14108]
MIEVEIVWQSVSSVVIHDQQYYFIMKDDSRIVLNNYAGRKMLDYYLKWQERGY